MLDFLKKKETLFYEDDDFYVKNRDVRAIGCFKRWEDGLY